MGIRLLYTTIVYSVMRIITSLMITLGLMSFQSRPYDYEKAWKEVAQFLNDQLPQSALNKTREIYGVAKQENNKPHLVKSIDYRSFLTQRLAGEESTDHLIYLMSEYDALKSTEKKLVGLILHSNLKSYYRSYNYKIKDRTFIEGETPEDINEWAPLNYENALLELSEEILADPSSLKVKSASYAPILTTFNGNGIKLRPYLIDVVSHYLLDDLSQPLNSISSFDLSFNIHDDKLLTSWDEFIELELTCEDPGNHAFRALKIYQDLISFHSDDPEKDALLDADLSRFKYVLGKSNLSENHQAFLNVLEAYEEEFSSEFNLTRVYYEQALTLKNQSEREGQEMLLKKAHEICTEHMGGSYYGNEMARIKDHIEMKQLRATSQQVFSSKEDIKIKLSHTNIPNLSWRLVAIPRNFREDFRRLYEDDFHNYITSLNPVSEGKLDISLDPNFKAQESIISIPSQQYGLYAVILSPSDEFKNIEEGLTMVTFQVSDIAYASLGGGQVDLLIADRITGKPIRGAKVELFTTYYDRALRQNKKQFVKSLKSDRSGRVKYSDYEGKSITVEISKGDDFLDVNDNYYIYNYPRPEVKRLEAMLFTDRSIYRPGQKLYFKALLLEKDKNGIPELGRYSREIEVVLRDANYQEVNRKSFLANEFGSFSGHFIIPSSGLTGQHIIEVINDKGLFSSHSVLVEAYRRPNFKVTVDQPSGKYSIGDSINVNGRAVAFSSASIDGAKVSYRIYRSELRRWWWYRGFPGQGEKVMIDYGITHTNVDGKFGLSFLAKGDDTKSWTYEIEVDVTDINGETQSGNLDLVLGKNALNITLNGPKQFDVSDTSRLYFSITNQSGEKLSEALKVKIIELQPLMDQLGNLNQNNPLTRIRDWESLRVIKEDLFAPEQEKYISPGDLNAGAYKIEMIIGELIVEDYILVTDFENEQFSVAADLYVQQVGGAYAPGDKVQFKIGSPHQSMYVFHEETRWEDRNEKGWMKLEGSSMVDAEVRKGDYGGLYVVLTYFFENRFRSITQRIEVPWTHKELDIELITYRNELIPGSNEEWTVKISGSGKDQKAIEVLASMYDQSLDQFVSHNWNSNLYPGYSVDRQWSGKGYGIVNGMDLVSGWNLPKPRIANEEIKFPRLSLLLSTYHPGYYRSDKILIRGQSMAPDAESQPAMESVSDAAMEAKSSANIEEDKPSEPSAAEPALRSDLDETVFFYPHLHTDKEGNILLKFKMKEALTRWKLMLFAHDEDFRVGSISKEIITKKDLMITPYFPRVVRQGDEVMVNSKINNLTQDTLEAFVSIEVFNARTMEDIREDLTLVDAYSKIVIPPGQSQSVSWKLLMPTEMKDPVLYRVWALGSNHKDGQEGLLPVLTNKVLITETKAITLYPNETFVFNSDQVDQSETRDVLNITMDYTAHPAWTALQALPYLADYPHDCVEQMMNKIFANEVGAKILNSVPGMKRTLDQ